MNGYNKYTPLRIAVPFILGIAFVLNTGFSWPVGLSMLIILFCFICLLTVYHYFRTLFSFRWASGLLANVSLFFLGTLMIMAIEQKNSLKLERAAILSPGDLFLCSLDSKPLRKSNSTAGHATVIALADSLGQWHKMEINILLYLKDDTLCESLEYGDLILVSGDLVPVPGPPNPEMFDYRQYLYNRKIFYQVFIKEGHWRLAGRISQDPVRAWAELCREKFVEILKKFRIEGQEFALASALLLGSKDFLDNDVKQEFSHAGAMHVLCVSGLHVGILFVVADKFLFFLKRGRRNRKLHHLLILLIIWSYAFITGLSASVMRASLMFTLIAAGKMFKRSSENYNMLAVAAFFQLWINPFEITQVGFQLSYLAVLGIFAFYQPLNGLIYPYHKALSWVWSIIAVSMAAQLATFPLASHYFNMFPVYFLLTNLVVVPLAAVIIYLAVILLAAGSVGFSSEWIGWPLKWSLRFMQGSVEFIQSMPGAVIEPVMLSSVQVILLYLVIISLFAYSVLVYRRWIFVLLGSFFILSLYSTILRIEKMKITEIVVYQVPGHTAIDLLYNRNTLFICDSILSCDQAKIDFQIKPNRMKNIIKDIRIIEPGDVGFANLAGAWADNPFIYFRGKKLVIIDETWRPPHQGHLIACDLAIISGNVQISPEELEDQIAWQYLVIDSSVPYYRAEKMVQDFKNEGISCYSVRHEGAFVIRW